MRHGRAWSVPLKSLGALTNTIGKETPVPNKQKALVAVLTIAMAAAAGVAVNASAATKKQLSYEQAWAHCKALLDQEKQPGDLSSGQHRTFRGKACMHKYGYNI
jgi:hypothetical protein